MVVNTLNSIKRSNTEDKIRCFGNGNVNTNFGKEQYLVKTVFLPNKKTHGAKIDLIGVHTDFFNISKSSTIQIEDIVVKIYLL